MPIAGRDKSSLDEFEAKHQQWASWCTYDPNEPNTLEAQLASLLLTELEFRTVKLAHEQGLQLLANPILRRSIERGYIALQIAAIRKLTEGYDPSRDKNRLRGVISLRRLVDDLTKNLHLFSRRNYVCRGGFQYEPPLPLSALAEQDHNFGLVENPDLRRWMAIARRHEIFDLLSGKTRRQPSDEINVNLLGQAANALQDEKLLALIEQGNKFIFHAADPDSRKYTSASSVPLETISSAHRTLVRTESLLVDFLITPEVARDTTLRAPPTVFAGLADSEEKADALRTHWKMMASERNEWRVKAEEFIGNTFQLV